MRHFPAFLDLQGRITLVVGLGEVGERKAEALRRCGAQVVLRARFDEADLDGCAVAIGADAELAELTALAAAARARGIPVNVVDKPDLCSFIMPAVIDRDPVTIAISTGGAAPTLARLLRARIEAVVPPAFGRLAALSGRLSERLRARFTDLAARRRVLERILTGRAAAMVFAGDEAAAADEAAREMDAAEGAPREGMVFLVGGGPGAADLVTLRALRLLGEADVIVHDRLVSDAVLDLARRDARRIFVGKARANHCMKQAEINALLVRLAREGNKVVRLKGGDPLVFGRGGEEAEALAAAGMAFEIVPGITAALACAADAGIALTHRDYARTVTMATAHTRDGTVDLDFNTLARQGGTLALYMGLHTIGLVRDGLVTAGLPLATPAALIERGGTAQRRVLAGDLESVARHALDWSTGGPIMNMIGEAVARRSVGRSTEMAALV